MHPLRYCYFGHHKCASTWFASILHTACQDLGFSWNTVGKIGDRADDFVNLTLFRNATREIIPEGNIRGFHVIRDPRDILVSAYFSHLYSHPTDVWEQVSGARKTLSELTPEEGLVFEMEFIDEVFQSIFQWDYERPDILELKLEQAMADPYGVWIVIFEFLKLLPETPPSRTQRVVRDAQALFNALRRPPSATGKAGVFRPGNLTAERLLGIAYTFNFKRLAGGRKQGEEDQKSHFRKGVAGDWKNHFTPHVKSIFKEKYGPDLIRLGYESNQDW